MKEKLEFKIASEDWEFKQIYELNYRTFVEEIPQHEKNEERFLVDKFHRENSYIICTRGRKLLGMMAVRDKRPFSLDNKLNDLDSHLPYFKCPCEFRLLSIEKEYRNLRIIQGLMIVLAKFADEKGYDIALISANVKRLKFYKQIGFKSFGPEVGSEEAKYQPMYLTLESSRQFRKKSKLLKRLPENFSIHDKDIVNLVPGPVDISNEVRKAMNEEPVSHRSWDFIRDFKLVQKKLCKLTGSKHIEILMGSGSLANDAVAAQLSLLKGKGLILSNGEFGERLFDHANRFKLVFSTIRLAWGDAFNPKSIEQALIQDSEIKWVWAVHSETSTGVLNDINMLKKICDKNEKSLCLDCVSSLGVVPVDLSRVYLASGVSGKGLASYSGLSFVSYNHEIFPNSDSIPRYMDIGFYSESGGIPFTISSNLVYALSAALETIDIENRVSEIQGLSDWVRSQILNIGLDIVSKKENAAPAVVTISLPDWIRSSELGDKLEDEGFLLHWKSSYLQEKNWIQIALMTKYSKEQIKPLFQLLSVLTDPLRKAL